MLSVKPAGISYINTKFPGAAISKIITKIIGKLDITKAEITERTMKRKTILSLSLAGILTAGCASMIASSTSTFRGPRETSSKSA